MTARAGGEAGAVVGQGYDPYQAVARQRTGRAAQDLVRGLPLPIVLPAVPSQGLADPTVSADAYQAILMVERLRQGGDRTSEALGWLSRQTTPRLVGLLDAVVGTAWGADLDWVDTLVAALLGRYGLDPQETAGLPERVRLRIADYLARRSDQRCVRLYEAILDAHPGCQDRWAEELYGLARYYAATGDYRRAADTLCQVDRWSSKPACRADYYLQAARYLEVTGDRARAAQVVRRLPEFRSGWATGLAYIDQARWLVQAGNWQDALSVLAQPVEGPGAEQVAVGVQVARALALYVGGAPAEARRTYEAALRAFGQIHNPDRGKGVMAWVEEAKEGLYHCDRFVTHAAVVSPGTVAVLAGGQAKVIRSIRVEAPRPLTLEEVGQHPGVVVRGDEPWERVDPWTFAQRLWLTIEPAAMPAAETRLQWSVVAGAGAGQATIGDLVVLVVREDRAP